MATRALPSEPAGPGDRPEVAGQRTLFGHPIGLFTLFFAEMWERFSFYGMRALLVFYMTKSFLQYGDQDATAVYGAYTALVYMTPFFGGMLADRLLGCRLAVITGGLLMAAGHLLMAAPQKTLFFCALALLIAGNGFFKPNISTIVGTLYPHASSRRDGGFTIFYMGVNLGAGLAPLLCGYVGETYGYHYGFGLATIGMLTGVAIFVAPTLLTQLLIATGVIGAAAGLFFLRPDDPFTIGLNIFTGIALLISGAVACGALQRGGIPAWAGGPPDPERLRRPVFANLTAPWLVGLGTVAAIAMFVLLVSGFGLSADSRPMALVPDKVLETWEASSHAAVRVLAVVARENSRPAALVLMLAGLGAFGYVIFETVRLERIARQRMWVVLILTVFSMLFWLFFEQAGTSMNNFTDRNVDRVTVHRRITPDEVGQTIRLQPTQAQLGHRNGDAMFTNDILSRLRDEHKDDPRFTIEWKVAADNVGMGIADRDHEIPASMFQSVNALYILMLGLPFTAIWTWLARRRLEPSTPVKFALGLLQLGLGFAALWEGARLADGRGMVALGWLLLCYFLHTTGELCLSPVGLSMVTKLSPTRLVSTVMGTWFLATAFSESLAAMIAQFMAMTKGGHGQEVVVPPPQETVRLYGEVFGKIAVAAVVASLACFALAPLLSRWMHPEADAPADAVA